MADAPVIIERTFNAPADKVWKAITDVKEMEKWYFKLEDFKAQVGFEFQFYGGTEEKQYLHLCKVTEVVPGKKLTYSWRYDNYPGNSFVSFELFPEGDKTRLKLTHTGLETFPYGTDANFSKESFTAGWTYIVGTSLNDFVENNNTN